MNYAEKEARLWSRLGPRATFGTAMVQRAKVDERLLALSADTRSSAGLEPFRREFPDRYIDFGIAEQNMILAAAALASEGFHVVTTTFSPFETMRCCEQIRVQLGLMRLPVVMVGLGAGLVLGEQGFTHCCFEDVGVLRSIPNLTILEPADCGAVVQSLDTALALNSPVYLRLTGGPRCAMVYPSPAEITAGRANVLRDGSEPTQAEGQERLDAAIFSAGASVAEALRAADILAEQGITAAVVDMVSVKPLDTAVIDQFISPTDRQERFAPCLPAENGEISGRLAEKPGWNQSPQRAQILAVVEEHNIYGGLADAVAGHLAQKGGAPPLQVFGVSDRYVKPGPYRYLLEQYGLTAENIAKTLKIALDEEKRGTV